MPIFKDSCNPTREDRNNRIFTTQCITNNLKAVIFRDSFFTALEPYTSRYFKHTTYIRNTINFKELNEFVKKDQPHIVINEMVERTIPYYIPDINGFN